MPRPPRIELVYGWGPDLTDVFKSPKSAVFSAPAGCAFVSSDAEVQTVFNTHLRGSQSRDRFGALGAIFTCGSKSIHYL